MLPYQVREAIDKNVPVILPLGVVEYHAEHLPLGVDCFTCLGAIERVEERHPEIVVLPPFYYGSASYAVANPERNGTVHVDALKIVPVAEDIFRGLLRVGFRNIHCFIAHTVFMFISMSIGNSTFNHCPSTICTRFGCGIISHCNKCSK